MAPAYSPKGPAPTNAPRQSKTSTTVSPHPSHAVRTPTASPHQHFIPSKPRTGRESISIERSQRRAIPAKPTPLHTRDDLRSRRGAGRPVGSLAGAALSVRLLRCACGSVARCARFLLVRSLRSLIAFVMGGFLASPVGVGHLVEIGSFFGGRVGAGGVLRRFPRGFVVGGCGLEGFPRVWTAFLVGPVGLFEALGLVLGRRWAATARHTERPHEVEDQRRQWLHGAKVGGDSPTT